MAILFSLIGVGIAYALNQHEAPAENSNVGRIDRAGEAPGAAVVSPLRRQQVPADLLPSAVADSPLLADGVAEIESARRVGAETDNGWIMPGRSDSICHARDGFLNCAPAQSLVERGLAPSVASRDGVFRIDGIAADGVDSVDVRLWDGSIVRAPVANNAFILKSSQPAREVQWQGPRGAEAMSFEWFYRISKRQERLIRAEESAGRR